MNNFFEFYGYTTDIIDRSKEQQVSVYTIKAPEINGVRKLDKDVKLFDFKYIPIINLEVRNELIYIYRNYPIITKLLDSLNITYYFLFESCVKKFSERKKSARNVSSFYENEINFFENKKFDKNSYSEMRNINSDSLNDINIYIKVKGLMERAVISNIEDINYLFYGVDNQFPKDEPVKEYSVLMKCLINNLYWNFLDFLKEQLLNKDLDVEKTKSQEIKIPDNPYPRIFINGYAYLLFKELKDTIVINSNHSYADYSFIMQRMIENNYLIQTNHVKLIEFVDEEYNAKIGKRYNQFNTSLSKFKKDTFSILKKKFNTQIKSLL